MSNWGTQAAAMFEGMGEGSANYLVAKEDPAGYVQWKMWTMIIGIVLFVLLLVFIAFAIWMAPKPPQPTPPPPPFFQPPIIGSSLPSSSIPQRRDPSLILPFTSASQYATGSLSHLSTLVPTIGSTYSWDEKDEQISTAPIYPQYYTNPVTEYMS